MYFITRPWFCQHLFAIIFILFDRDRFSRVRTAFFADFFLHPSPRFLPAARTAGLRSGIFARFFLYPLIWASCGRRFAPAGSAHFFPAKSRSKRKTSIFYDFSCIAFVILVL